MPDAPGDQITLVLPASPGFARIARLTCAGLATRIGLGYDEVEDVRIGVGEACSLLIADGARTGTLTLVCDLVPDALEIDVLASLSGSAPRPEATDVSMSEQILSAVADAHVIDLGADRVWLRKQHPPRPRQVVRGSAGDDV